MIYLRGPGLIFLKPYKVGGTSFEIALSKFALGGDIVTPINQDETLRASLGCAGPQNYLFAEAEQSRATDDDWARARRMKSPPLKFYNHMSARTARDRLPEEDWQCAHKISIVRNPYDAAVSLYYWDQRHYDQPMPFAEWCMRHHRRLTLNREKYVIDDDIVIDRFIRFEQFDLDVTALEKDFPALSGLSKFFSQITAKGNARPKTATTATMFAEQPALRKLIERCCAFEIETFGYRLV